MAALRDGMRERRRRGTAEGEAVSSEEGAAPSRLLRTRQYLDAVSCIPPLPDPRSARPLHETIRYSPPWVEWVKQETFQAVSMREPFDSIKEMPELSVPFPRSPLPGGVTLPVPRFHRPALSARPREPVVAPIRLPSRTA